MYRIIGGDGKEYGPVPREQLVQWIQEGRANAETQACEEDGAWRPLSSFGEFSAHLMPGQPPEPPIAPATDPSAPAAEAVTSEAGSTSTPPPPPPHVANLLLPAIFVTLCCCLPAGIPAIVYAVQANARRNAGDWANARSAARNAQIWCWVALAFGILAAYIGLKIAPRGFR